jgi:hypothetical protein
MTLSPTTAFTLLPATEGPVRVMKSAPARRSLGLVWALTLAAFSLGACGLVASNTMGGLVDSFLIAGAIMVFVTVLRDRPMFSSAFRPPALPKRAHRGSAWPAA